MPSVSLWAFSAENYFFIANKPALRSWLVCFFTEKVASCAESGRCLLYTSDAADEEDSVDLGGRRIIKIKKKKKKNKKKEKSQKNKIETT